MIYDKISDDNLQKAFDKTLDYTQHGNNWAFKLLREQVLRHAAREGLLARKYIASPLRHLLAPSTCEILTKLIFIGLPILLIFGLPLLLVIALPYLLIKAIYTEYFAPSNRNNPPSKG
ncbi:hypothetical protein [Corallococcus macrosporus]|uniref:hypothetical protein n=1 Tax=Corallococcus macrosporus TaxID=35 RepID=UPI000F4E09BB|nr:hypothetical protein [Corallococcus macrosporus]